MGTLLNSYTIKIIDLFTDMSDKWPNKNMIVFAYTGKKVYISKYESPVHLKYIGIKSWIDITEIYKLSDFYYRYQKKHHPEDLVLQRDCFIVDCILKEGFPYNKFYKKHILRKLKFKNIID